MRKGWYYGDDGDDAMIMMPMTMMVMMMMPGVRGQVQCDLRDCI